MTRLYLGLASVSAATLLYEIALTRLFAVAHGYHFAFLAVSLALLGFGASGTALALRPSRSGGLDPGGLAWLALAGAAGLLASYVAANRVPFDPYRVAWEPKQLLFLAAYLLALAAPFFLVGLVQGLPLVARPERAGRLYAAMLAGSGLGCLLALGALSWLGEAEAPVLAALVAAGGAAVLAPSPRALLPAAGLVAALAFLLWQPPGWLDLRLSPYKPLSQLLTYPGTRLLARESSPLARLDVVASSAVRSAPGLSLGYEGPLPRQTAVVVDAENVLALTARESVPPAFFDSLPVGLLSRLRPGGSFLVLEPGGALDVLAALAGGAGSVVAVERNPGLADLVRSRFSERAGRVYGDPRVRLVVSGGRAYVARSSERFDVVELALSESFRPVTAGAFSLSESYLLTKEAFRAYLERLAPDGILAVHRWLQLPPTEELRAAALLVGAVEEAGADARRSVVAVRSFSTMLLLGKRSPFTERELALVRAFARERRFDLVYLPGIRPEEANRFNVLRDDPYYRSFQRLLAEPEELWEDYEYDVAPVGDDRPFFFHFFKWEQTPTVLELLGKTWQPFGGSGYLVLLALLALVAGLSLVLVAVPIAVTLRRRRGGKRGGWAWPSVYFGALGLGFLLVEVALIQRTIALLDHPAYALAVVLFGLLLFSGVGSALSERVPWSAALAALVAAAALYPFLLARVFAAALGQSFAVRVLVVLLLLAPLGLLLGVPFPRGLALLGRADPDWLPLAWGVNGFASVVSAILAALVALSWGFTFVFAGAALAYVLALTALLASPARAARR